MPVEPSFPHLGAQTDGLPFRAREIADRCTRSWGREGRKGAREEEEEEEERAETEVGGGGCESEAKGGGRVGSTAIRDCGECESRWWSLELERVRRAHPHAI